MMRFHPILVLLASPALSGQSSLTAQQAVATALERHASIQAGAEEAKAAAARISQARGALAPRVDYTESWQRGNNQVFVFGTLLTQKQFSESNFDVDSLNNPPFLNNFQSQVILDQTVYDNGLRRSRIRAAELGRDAAVEESRRTETGVIAGVLRAYYVGLVSQAHTRVAAEAVRSAEADLQRAESRRTAGVTTDADVLSIRVHLASVNERRIRAGSDLEIAMAALNQAMGLPLDSPFDLTTPLVEAQPNSATAVEVEKDAVTHRPELKEARLATSLTEANSKAAHAALLPEFYVRGVFEADRQRFVTRGGANWTAAAGLRWNLFNGLSDRARIDEAAHEVERSRAQARLLESATRLEARRALLDLASAGKRIEVARASVEMAREGLRIIRNRYEAGLTEVTELLRSETALLETQTRELEAIRDQRLAAVALEVARGTLTKDSEVVAR